MIKIITVLIISITIYAMFKMFINYKQSTAFDLDKTKRRGSSGVWNEEIDDIIRAWCEESKLEAIGYSYDYDTRTLYIYANRPGYLIGRAGNIIDKYQVQLKDSIANVNAIKFVEVDNMISNKVK